MTDKKIQPKNPDTTTSETDTGRDTERKSMSYRFGSRKLARKAARKTNNARWG